jgi:hypothetical protein
MYNHINSYKESFCNASFDLVPWQKKITRSNINALIKECTPSDMLWAPRSTCFEYVMSLKRSK